MFQPNQIPHDFLVSIPRNISDSPRQLHCVIPTRDTRWPWSLCHGSFGVAAFVFHAHQQSGWIFALAACTQTTYRKHMLSPLGTGCSCKRHSCKHFLLGHRFTFEAQRLYQLKAWPSSSKPKCHNFRSLIPQRSDHKSVCQHPSCANAAAVSRALVSGYARSHQRTWLTATSATHLLQSEGAWPCQCPISNQPPKLSPRALNQKQTHTHPTPNLHFDVASPAGASLHRSTSVEELHAVSCASQRQSPHTPSSLFRSKFPEVTPVDDAKANTCDTAALCSNNFVVFWFLFLSAKTNFQQCRNCQGPCGSFCAAALPAPSGSATWTELGQLDNAKMLQRLLMPPEAGPSNFSHFHQSSPTSQHAPVWLRPMECR